MKKRVNDKKTLTPAISKMSADLMQLVSVRNRVAHCKNVIALRKSPSEHVTRVVSALQTVFYYLLEM